MKQTIMAVDDSDSVRQMVAFSLKQAGFDVVEANNGEAAVETLKQLAAPVSMIVTDLDMPRKNGIELIQAVRAMPAYKSIPIVVLTLKSDTELKQKAKAAGASGWITKPFTPTQLKDVVAKLLG